MTPDVNVLVAASRSDHPHHQSAITWLEAALTNCSRGERLRLLPMVAAGFLRLVTHPRVFVEPTPLAAAHDSTSWWATPSVMAGLRRLCSPAVTAW
jgi:predicted nucleic acid-binding protein